MRILFKILIGIIGLLLFLNYLGSHFPIGSAHILVDENIQITVKVKECILCYRDPDYQKKVLIEKGGKRRKFKLEITQERPTTVILGKTKVESIFLKNGIEELVIFPNNWGAPDVFNFDTEKKLDVYNYKEFKDEVFWDLSMVKSELIIEIDTLITLSN